jgi:hypothetical protein
MEHNTLSVLLNHVVAHVANGPDIVIQPYNRPNFGKKKIMIYGNYMSSKEKQKKIYDVFT